MGESWRCREEPGCLPSPRSDAEFSLHVPQNSSRYELRTDTAWKTSRKEIGLRLTLPNALDINRPMKKTAERSASSLNVST